MESFQQPLTEPFRRFGTIWCLSESCCTILRRNLHFVLAFCVLFREPILLLDAGSFVLITELAYYRRVYVTKCYFQCE